MCNWYLLLLTGVDKEVRISFQDDATSKIELRNESVEVTVSNRSFFRCANPIVLSYDSSQSF